MAESTASETVPPSPPSPSPGPQQGAQADAPTLVPPPRSDVPAAASGSDAKPSLAAPEIVPAPDAPVQNGNGAHDATGGTPGRVNVIQIPPGSGITLSATRPLAPAHDSPFGSNSASIDATLPLAPGSPAAPNGNGGNGGAVASAAHLPSLSGVTAPIASGSGQSNRVPPSYIPMPSGVIPMPSGAAWQKVNAQIPAAPPQAVLAATGLRKRFGKREVVRGVEIQVGAGEIVGLLGRNGAGKTTTFRMIMGLLHPDQGRVLYENRDISRMPMYERANRGIGYLAQQPSIFQRLTVEENLLAVLELQERDKKKRWERLEALIADLGLNTVRKSMASVLSGGERRRLEIARAMSLKPRVVLFDEPFAGIDPIAVSEIQGILRDLKGQGVGVLLTDHNVRETLTITDRTYIMDEGTIWIHGPPREIVANPDARARYLGHDFRLDF